MKTEDKVSKQAIRSVVRHYIDQYKKYPFSAACAFILPAIGTILVFFVPPLVLARLIDMFAARGFVSMQSTGTLVAIFAGSWFAGEVCWRVGVYYLIRLKAKSFTDLDRKTFQLLSNRESSFYADNFVGSLTNKAHSFTIGFEIFTDIVHYNLFANLFTLVFASIVLWKYSPILPLLLLGCIVVLMVVALPLIRKRSKLTTIRQKASSKMAGTLSDVLTNIAAVKSFATEEREYKNYDAQSKDFAIKYQKAADFHNQRIDAVISPLYVATNALGLIAAIFLIGNLGLQPSIIVVVFAYYTQITYIFWQINYTYRSIESAMGGAAEFTELFIEPAQIVDAQNAKEFVVHEGSIQFEKIGFDYGEGRKHPFLHHFNLKIPAGQKVGLVGPSGGGKTTITKLLLRFADTHSGTISIDGQAIKEVTQASLRSAIAYVPQDPLLFHRTLRENIAYGQDGATDADVIEAAKLAHAHEFISELPEGYDTMVGERGIKLSGGQRQRIAIARALLKKSKILVLDEATSALDSESEKYIQEGLWELMKNKTALVIAHRLSTIRHLDRIIVLDKGKIVQDGTHDELIAQEGSIYAKLWNHQSGGFLEE